MTCQWSSIRNGSAPIRYSASWATAVWTVSERPSQDASPQPTRPPEVSMRTNSHRGATRKVSTRSMRSMAQPFVAPAVRPETMYFCANRDMIMIGRVTTVDAAMRAPQSIDAYPMKS